jgi:sortase A
MAIGLLGYYGLTNALGDLAQRQIRDEAPDVAPFRVRDPNELLGQGAPGAPGDSPFDFTGWEAEDRAYWEALEIGGVFGRIVIPAMDLDVMVVKGADLASLRKGPGWITWTDLPGPTGRAGISGHRSTYSGPFQHLELLVEGETVDFYSPYRLYRYVVTNSVIVLPTAVEIVASTDEPTLALTACHPPWGNEFRIVAEADLVEVRRITEAEE